jgi:hypothetical protein
VTSWSYAASLALTPGDRHDLFSYSPFDLAFWHPFGPHGDETSDKIAARKSKEIADNGWTLWSFQSRSREFLAAWWEQLRGEKGPVLVFCSYSPKAKRPSGDPVYSESYRFVDDLDGPLQPIPYEVRVPHHFGKVKVSGCAFKVKKVTGAPEPFRVAAAEWFVRDCICHWRYDSIPTRGEYLIRPGGTQPTRLVTLVLELEPPYLALVYPPHATEASP